MNRYNEINIASVSSMPGAFPATIEHARSRSPSPSTVSRSNYRPRDAWVSSNVSAASDDSFSPYASSARVRSAYGRTTSDHGCASSHARTAEVRVPVGPSIGVGIEIALASGRPSGMIGLLSGASAGVVAGVLGLIKHGLLGALIGGVKMGLVIGLSTGILTVFAFGAIGAYAAHISAVDRAVSEPEHACCYSNAGDAILMVLMMAQQPGGLTKLARSVLN